MNKDTMFSSKNQKWETPQDLFDKLNEVFKFDIDLAAEDETAKCDVYYTVENDAFKYDWKENNCWLNPPYGREQIKWVKRSSDEVEKWGNTIVMLIPARPDTKVWHETIFPNASIICFVKGRLKFGGVKESAPFPSALIVFGEVNEEQIKVLDSLGKVFKNK